MSRMLTVLACNILTQEAIVQRARAVVRRSYLRIIAKVT